MGTLLREPHAVPHPDGQWDLMWRQRSAWPPRRRPPWSKTECSWGSGPVPQLRISFQPWPIGIFPCGVSRHLLAPSQPRRELDISVEPFTFDRLDLAIDGADQINPEGWLVKGGGAAHTREKLVAASAQRFVVIADSTKAVVELHAPVPLELLAFGIESTLERLGDVRIRGVPPSPDGGVIADFFGPFADPRSWPRTWGARLAWSTTGFSRLILCQRSSWAEAIPQRRSIYPGAELRSQPRRPESASGALRLGRQGSIGPRSGEVREALSCPRRL